MTTFASLKDQIESLYLGYFGRTDDGAGTSYWVNQIESGAMTSAKVAESFAVQPEALAKYSYLSAPSIGSPTDFVNQVYQQLFNHAADAAGLAYWTAQLTAAQGNPQAIGQFIGNVISGATGADDTTIRNKLDVASGVTPKEPDISTPSTVSVTPQPPTEIVSAGDTVPPSGADQFVISGGATILKLTTTGTSSVFFTMYDATSSGTVALIGSVNMSPADYAHIIDNHFSVAAA